jgi:hypothetical protein
MPESFNQRKILIPNQEEIQPPVQLPARLCENCYRQFQSAPLVSHLPGLQSRRICAIQRQKSDRALAGRDSSNPGTNAKLLILKANRTIFCQRRSHPRAVNAPTTTNNIWDSDPLGYYSTRYVTGLVKT